MTAINFFKFRCFKGNKVESIIDALTKEKDKTWSEETINTLLKMSPTSLKVGILKILGFILLLLFLFKIQF